VAAPDPAFLPDQSLPALLLQLPQLLAAHVVSPLQQQDGAQEQEQQLTLQEASRPSLPQVLPWPPLLLPLLLLPLPVLAQDWHWEPWREAAQGREGRLLVSAESWA